MTLISVRFKKETVTLDCMCALYLVDFLEVKIDSLDPA